MSITLNKIVSDIRNMADSGQNTYEFRIEDSQISYWIDQCWATLISQSLQKRPDINDIWVQSIGCLDLIQVDKSECCEIETDCMILRTELQIPRTIDCNKDNMIIRVESINGDIISKTNIFASKYNKYSKYTSTKPMWFIKNDYIYIINSNFLSKINIYGIFETPSDLTNFINCNGNTCFDDNSVYPCTSKMASTITDIVYKTKVIPYLQTPQDNINNANNDLQTSNPTK